MARRALPAAPRCLRIASAASPMAASVSRTIGRMSVANSRRSRSSPMAAMRRASVRRISSRTSFQSRASSANRSANASSSACRSKSAFWLRLIASRRRYRSRQRPMSSPLPALWSRPCTEADLLADFRPGRPEIRQDAVHFLEDRPIFPHIGLHQPVEHVEIEPAQVQRDVAALLHVQAAEQLRNDVLRLEDGPAGGFGVAAVQRLRRVPDVGQRAVIQHQNQAMRRCGLVLVLLVSLVAELVGQRHNASVPLSRFCFRSMAGLHPARHPPYIWLTMSAASWLFSQAIWFCRDASATSMFENRFLSCSSRWARRDSMLSICFVTKLICSLKPSILAAR